MFAAFALLGAAAFWRAGSFGAGAGLLPRIASGGMVIMGMLGIVLGPGRAEVHRETPGGRRSYATLAAFAGYGLIMPVLGFMVTTFAAALALVIGISGMRTWKWAIVVVAFVVVVYELFTTIFLVGFPTGALR